MNIVLSIVVLVALALLVGAWQVKRRGGTNKQATLMAVLALIMLGNVMIWSLPTSTGDSLASVAAER